MKTHRLILLAACILALLSPSCTLTQEQKDKMTSNLAKDADAALVGGLTTGTWAGAAAAASAQVIRNRTSAKNSGKPVVP